MLLELIDPFAFESNHRFFQNFSLLFSRLYRIVTKRWNYLKALVDHQGRVKDFFSLRLTL